MICDAIAAGNVLLSNGIKPLYAHEAISWCYYLGIWEQASVKIELKWKKFLQGTTHENVVCKINLE